MALISIDGRNNLPKKVIVVDCTNGYGKTAPQDGVTGAQRNM